MAEVTEQSEKNHTVSATQSEFKTYLAENPELTKELF